MSHAPFFKKKPSFKIVANQFSKALEFVELLMKFIKLCSSENIDALNNFYHLFQ